MSECAEAFSPLLAPRCPLTPDACSLTADQAPRLRRRLHNCAELGYNTRTMHATRRAILEYLRQHPGATVNDLARALEMTPANVRHHLAILKAQGLVEAMQTRFRYGHGRPPKHYRLTDAAQPMHLEPLTRALLDYIHEEGPQVLADVARRMCASFPTPLRGNLRERVQQALTILQGWHYAPRWEAHHEGPRILFSQCPFGALARDYPSLCQLDAHLLSLMLGAEVEHDGRPTHEPPCVFRVKPQSLAA